MKRLSAVIFCAFFVASLFLGKAALAADNKFAYVDLSRLFSEYKKTQDYDKVLGQKENAYTAERDKKFNEFKAYKDKYDLLSDKEKEAKRADLEDRAKKIQDYDRQKQTDLRKDQDEKMKEILKDIEDAVKSYSEKQGYTFVLNDRVLVYQDKSLDITQVVLDIMNKDYKKR